LIGPLSTYVKPNEGFAATPDQQYLEPKTIFTSGQAGGAFQILADFVPDLQRSISSLTLGIFRDVNSSQKRGCDYHNQLPVFGYRASGGGTNTDDTNSSLVRSTRLHRREVLL
jgi:hypothetical protein